MTDEADRGGTAAVCVAVDFGAGGAAPGAAHVLEHVALSGGDVSFAATIERTGGYVNAETRYDSMVFYVRTAPEELEAARLALLNALDAVALDDEVVRREIAVATREIADATGSRRAAHLRFLELVYRGVGAAASPGGAVHDLTVLNRTHIDAAAQRFARAGRVVATTGAGGDEVVRLRSTGERDLALPHLGRPITDHAGHGESVWIFVGGLAPLPRTDPRRYAFDVLASHLSNSPASPLYAALRAASATSYRFRSATSFTRDFGSWRVEALVRSADVDAVETDIRRLLTRVSDDGLDDEDLRAAQARARMRLHELLDDPLERAKLLATTRLGGDAPADAPHRQLNELGRVRAADVAGAARTLLDSLVSVVR